MLLIANTGDHEALEARILIVTKRNPGLTFGSIRDSLTSEGQTCLNRLFLLEVSQNNQKLVTSLLQLGAHLDACSTFPLLPNTLSLDDLVKHILMMPDDHAIQRASLLDVNERGDTAFHIAAERGNHELLKILCEQANCDSSIPPSQKPFNLSNFFGETPLHVAADNFGYDCAKVLLSFGANITSQTLFGESALSTLFVARDRMLQPVRSKSDDDAGSSVDDSRFYEGYDPHSLEIYFYFTRQPISLWSKQSKSNYRAGEMPESQVEPYLFFMTNHRQFISFVCCLFALIHPFIDQSRQHLLSFLQADHPSDAAFRSDLMTFMTESIANFRSKPNYTSVMASMGITAPDEGPYNPNNPKHRFQASKNFADHGLQAMLEQQKQMTGSSSKSPSQQEPITELVDQYLPSTRGYPRFRIHVRFLEALFHRANTLQNMFDAHTLRTQKNTPLDDAV